eukprot:SAG31_NODE_1544_length_7943_cov_4.076237_1_plen_145_part_10
MIGLFAAGSTTSAPKLEFKLPAQPSTTTQLAAPAGTQAPLTADQAAVAKADMWQLLASTDLAAIRKVLSKYAIEAARPRSKLRMQWKALDKQRKKLEEAKAKSPTEPDVEPKLSEPETELGTEAAFEPRTDVEPEADQEPETEVD